VPVVSKEKIKAHWVFPSILATNGKKGIFYCKKQIIRISPLKLLLATVTKKKKILKLTKLISSQNVLTTERTTTSIEFESIRYNLERKPP
jgi:hypothetical protein